MKLNRGDVCMVDLGYRAKVRPCIIVSIPNADRQRNMSVVVPLTTESRGGECEVSFPKPKWLKEPSVANLIGIMGVDNAAIGRFVGRFDPAKLAEVENGIARMLGL